MVFRNFWLLEFDKILLLVGERMLLLEERRSALDLNVPLAIKFSFLFWLFIYLLMFVCFRTVSASILVLSISSSHS